MNGYNPMRWDCRKDGCFNFLQRPKIEEFCEAFPSNINFSDIDGIVEISGNALMLEWKKRVMPIPGGQKIMYERLTRGGAITVLVLAGDAQLMTITNRCYFINGTASTWKETTKAQAIEFMRRWAVWARAHPRLAAPNLRAVTTTGG